jgi:hypothetical protein
MGRRRRRPNKRASEKKAPGPFESCVVASPCLILLVKMCLRLRAAVVIPLGIQPASAECTIVWWSWERACRLVVGPLGSDALVPKPQANRMVPRHPYSLSCSCLSLAISASNDVFILLNSRCSLLAAPMKAAAGVSAPGAVCMRTMMSFSRGWGCL